MASDPNLRHELLDHGYVEHVEHWGSDASIIEAARMSTQKGFKGWGPQMKCSICELAFSAPNNVPGSVLGYPCKDGTENHDWQVNQPGDEKLLSFLFGNHHDTPFEMAGAVLQIRAPIMVYREWHRHRTQSYNEESARYKALEPLDYVPAAENIHGRSKLAADSANKQQRGASARVCTLDEALDWINHDLIPAYEMAQRAYQRGLDLGVPKELARLPVPVARYSTMRASANLRNWIGFLRLREAPGAQWEIRQYAHAVYRILSLFYPRTMALYEASSQRVSE